MNTYARMPEGLEPREGALETALLRVAPSDGPHPRALEVVLEEDLGRNSADALRVRPCAGVAVCARAWLCLPYVSVR